jgi:hypothetical protein
MAGNHCWHWFANLICDCPGGLRARGRTAYSPHPSEAAYRRELRHGGQAHQACREAATLAKALRAARGRPSDLPADPCGYWPCQCPPVVATLEGTLAYVHGYAWTPTGWRHE